MIKLGASPWRMSRRGLCRKNCGEWVKMELERGSSRQRKGITCWTGFCHWHSSCDLQGHYTSENLMIYLFCRIHPAVVHHIKQWDLTHSIYTHFEKQERNSL